MNDTPPLFKKHEQVKPKSRRGGYRGKGGQMHPLKIEMRELARAYGPEVLEGLLRIFRDESVDVDMRMVAGNVILDRGFGKPVMAAPESGNGQVVVNVIGTGGKPMLPAPDAARFISDFNSVAAERSGPLMPDGTPVFERHAHVHSQGKTINPNRGNCGVENGPISHTQVVDPNSFRGQFEAAMAEDNSPARAENFDGRLTPREKREWAEQQVRDEGG